MGKQNTIGVIVGRFQADELTPGHVHLINTALLQNNEVLLLVGSNPARNEPNAPINFVWRCSMIQSDPRLFKAGKGFHILEIKDVGNDDVWMHDVQDKIRAYSLSDDLVRLYGSRDSSFLRCFKNSRVSDIKYEIVELLPFSDFSASERRGQIAKQYPSGREQDALIRQGMIIAANQRHPMVFSTVDVFPLQKHRVGANFQIGIWLGQKPKDTAWRFIGGFTEPTSSNDEADAVREVQEETGLGVDDLEYIGNLTVDDWRFRNSPNKIRTRMFVGTVIAGTAKGADDIKEVGWFPLSDIAMMPDKDIAVEHQPIRAAFRQWLDSQEGRNYISQFLLRKDLPIL